MNSVNITGRITKELELTYLNSGTAVCKFSIALSEKYNDVEKSHFFNCTAFGKQAEFIVNWCKKGGRVEITGKLQQNTWETKEGQKRSAVEIIVREVTPIDWKDKDSQSVQNSTPNVDIENNPFSDDDLPF